MKVIKFYGVRTREKHGLMLYLGNVLSEEYYVTLVTRGSFIQRTMSRIYYKDQFLITDEVDSTLVEPEFLLWDCDGNQPVQEVWPSDNVMDNQEKHKNMNVFVSTGRRNEVEANDFIVTSLEGEYWLVFQGLLFDSKISPSYLTKRYKVNQKKDHIILQYLNERDEALFLDNEYSESLSIKGLSKAYGKTLVTLLKAITVAPDKSIRSWVKKTARRG